MNTQRTIPRILASLVLTVCCLALAVAKLRAADPADDRQIALWVIQEGGEVLLEGQWDYIDDPFELPDGSVYIIGVNMHGTVTEAKDYEPLSRLSKLREIFIPARLWSPTFDTKGPFSDEMFGYFARSKTLERLHAGLTSLAYLRIGEEGVARLQPVSQLKDLRVGLMTITRADILAPFVNMEMLDLNDANVYNDMMPSLATMEKLRHLTMIGTLITDEGLKYVRDLTNLQELDLFGVKITDEGVQYLKKLTALRRLNLLGAQITDASADVLAGFKELRDLNLYRSRITNAGLAKLQTLPHLKILDLRYSAVTNAGVETFRAARPDCKVLFVSSTAPVEFTKGMQQPKANTVAGIAAWIEALGGKVAIVNGPTKTLAPSDAPLPAPPQHDFPDVSHRPTPVLP